MLELVKSFVSKVVAPDAILRSNQEILVLRHPGTGKKSIINSYPAASKTLRGSGGDVIWLEEAAFMPPSLFFEVVSAVRPRLACPPLSLSHSLHVQVLPLLEVDRTSMLAISTPSPEGDMNFYQTMLDATDKAGKPLFRVERIEMACQACKDAGVASECKHMESFRPPWKSKAKGELVRQIYTSSNNTAMLQRESMGLQVEEATTVFRQKCIRQFLKSSAPVHSSTRVLMMAMDPSGGGDSSMSLVTVSLWQNKLTLVAWDEMPIKGVDQMEVMLMRHVRVLRRHYPDHWIVCAFESNLGQESAHAAAMLTRERVSKHYVISEKERVGVLTTAARKALYADNLKFYLEQNALALRQGGVLTGNPAAGETARVAKVLHEQLTNYRRVTVEAAPGRIAKRQFSGKISGSRQDDLCLTLQLAAYWMIRFGSRSIPGVHWDTFA